MHTKERLKKEIEQNTSDALLTKIALLWGRDKNNYSIQLQLQNGLEKELADYFIDTATKEAIKRKLVINE